MNTQSSSRYAMSWLVFCLGAAFLFYKFIVEVSPSVMANQLMRTFHIQGTALGHLAATYFYAYLLMQIPVGLLIDRFGPRYLTTGAIVVCALGSLILSYSNHFWVACFGRFLTGAGAAFAVISCFKLVSNWFPPNRFALMAGITLTTGMLGAVGGQGPLAATIDYMGWRHALLLIACMGFVYAIAYFQIVRDRPVSVQSCAQETVHWRGFFKGFGYILKQPFNWLVSIYSGLAFAPIAVLGGLWGVPFLKKAYHISNTLAASDISLAFIGFAIGAPLFGFWSDCIGKRKPLIYLGTILAILFISTLIYLPNLPNTLVVILLFGFGFFISAFLISFTMIREKNPLPFAATSMAMMNTLNAALCAISDPLIGFFLDKTWEGNMIHGVPDFTAQHFQIAFTAIPVYLGLGLFLLYFCQETYCKTLENNAG